jgi:ribosomal protein L14E/L6E/L27E
LLIRNDNVAAEELDVVIKQIDDGFVTFVVVLEAPRKIVKLSARRKRSTHLSLYVLIVLIN